MTKEDWELERESAQTVYANIEAWLLEHAVKVETHDWAHFKSALAHGFRSYAKYLASLANGQPPFIKRIDENKRMKEVLKRLVEHARPAFPGTPFRKALDDARRILEL